MAGQLVARPVQSPALDRTLVTWTPLTRLASRLTGPFMEMPNATVHRLVTDGEWPGTQLQGLTDRHGPANSISDGHS
ncbi:hypothetical protein U879_21030 [Defluviimonas sp. 20V17]|uniref:Uncharacterized protein n=1 Tax=Allgaiera indica TaxID=765699 RepID=A0AAN5A0Q8_9RHOB|nr:hypothetical protein [Allgaiera indica]KDB01688.1 hypothetical protein U879_21030 [Defluviimonas sp. 20V17]GHE04019.1 hypothetical protein GCM10008024_29540 [Allgaiera indica]SDX34101.1 hypothetical protein SAMN05444006_11426 [Allgaiera indica]